MLRQFRGFDRHPDESICQTREQSSHALIRIAAHADHDPAWIEKALDCTTEPEILRNAGESQGRV